MDLNSKKDKSDSYKAIELLFTAIAQSRAINIDIIHLCNILFLDVKDFKLS